MICLKGVAVATTVRKVIYGVQLLALLQLTGGTPLESG
jgi:hypothetical protein